MKLFLLMSFPKIRTLIGCFVWGVQAVLLAGCSVHTQPDADTGFQSVSSLSSFDGCYRNKAESAGDAQPRHLSSLLWPEVPAVEQQGIEQIKVQSEGGNRFSVQGVDSAGLVVKYAHFLENEHFSYQQGVLLLKQAPLASMAAESGNPFIGFGQQTLKLGLDAGGHGRLEDTADFAGSAFIVIPVVGRVRDVYRFQRVPCQ